MASKIDKVEPSRVIPYKEHDEPTLAKDLNLMVEPINTGSNTDKVDPNSIAPYSESDVPFDKPFLSLKILAKFLKDNEEPIEQ
jgi:hypothetical protein